MMQAVPVTFPSSMVLLPQLSVYARKRRCLKYFHATRMKFKGNKSMTAAVDVGRIGGRPIFFSIVHTGEFGAIGAPKVSFSECMMLRFMFLMCLMRSPF